MVSYVKFMGKALHLFKALLLLTIHPWSDGSNNRLSDISSKRSSSGSVANNFFVDVNAEGQVPLEVVDNVISDVKVNGGSLKFLNNEFSFATLMNCDLEIMNCVNSDISGQKNKGIIKDFDNSDFTGNDNELDISHCDNCRLQSNKMTIVAQYSKDLGVQDSSNSKVKMLRVDSVQVSGRDFTLEGIDIQDHAFIGKGCSSGEKMTHHLTFLPSAKRPCPKGDKNVFCLINAVDNHFGIFGKKNYPTILKSCDKTWPLSLHFCNAAKVIGPTYEIGGLPRLTVEIKEEKAFIKVIDGNPECKIVSEEGKIKVSISTSSEELLIEGPKGIRRKEDGKCEFVLSLPLPISNRLRILCNFN